MTHVQNSSVECIGGSSFDISKSLDTIETYEINMNSGSNTDTNSLLINEWPVAVTASAVTKNATYQSWVGSHWYEKFLDSIDTPKTWINSELASDYRDIIFRQHYIKQEAKW